MKKTTTLTLLLAGLIALSGCVSKSTYNQTLAEKEELQSLTARQKAELVAQTNDLYEANLRLAEQTSLIDGLQSRIGKSALHKAALDKSLADTKQALMEMVERKAEMEKELRQFKELTTGLQSMINTGNVKVTFVKGRMVVSLGSDVLFRSGSAKLSQDGIDAVSKVSAQLAKIAGKDFQVEGHTDDVPIKTKEFPTNWQLASARAYSVLTTMHAAGMPEERISIASYADIRPAANNESAENRALNRRIDIVVLPDLSKLMDVDTIAKRTATSNRGLASPKPPQVTQPAEPTEGSDPSEE